MIAWAASWVWWLAWRAVTTLAAMYTLQHIIHEESGMWIETKPLLVGTVLMVLTIRIWSQALPRREDKCHSHPSTGSSGFSGPAS